MPLLTGETFERRGLLGPGRPLYTRSDQDIPVRLALGPSARWVMEYYNVEDARSRVDGWTEVTIPTKELPWVAKLVLRLGGEAKVVDPPELSAMVREAARVTLGRYRKASV